MSTGRRNIYLTLVALMFALSISGCTGNRPDRAENSNPLKEKWGIEAKSLHLTAGGNLLDFRYLVADPEKASSLFKTEDSKPHLVDKATGAILRIPKMPKIGALSTSMEGPVVGKTYFMLFANPGMLVRKGGEVALVIGDVSAENLTVE